MEDNASNATPAAFRATAATPQAATDVRKGTPPEDKGSSRTASFVSQDVSETASTTAQVANRVLQHAQAALTPTHASGVPALPLFSSTASAPLVLLPVPLAFLALRRFALHVLHPQLSVEQAV